jgi:hypothetical protein
MREFVRTRWASDLNHSQRWALKELAERESATVSGHPTEATEDDFNIHSSTALVLLRQGYAEETDDGGIAVTEDGLQKIGKIPVDREERRRKAAAASLEAQATGKWRPVPAGYSAAAERDAKDAKRFWAQAVSGVHAAKENLNRARKMLKLSEEWGAEEDELAACREDIEAAKKGVVEAEANLQSIKGEQKRAA